jgi:hypothetical protein
MNERRCFSKCGINSLAKTRITGWSSAAQRENERRKRKRKMMSKCFVRGGACIYKQ